MKIGKKYLCKKSLSYMSLSGAYITWFTKGKNYMLCGERSFLDNNGSAIQLYQETILEHFHSGEPLEEITLDFSGLKATVKQNEVTLELHGQRQLLFKSEIMRIVSAFDQLSNQR